MSIFGIVLGLVLAGLVIKGVRSKNFKNTCTIAAFKYEENLMEVAEQMDIKNPKKLKEIKEFRKTMDTLRNLDIDQ